MDLKDKILDEIKSYRNNRWIECFVDMIDDYFYNTYAVYNTESNRIETLHFHENNTINDSHLIYIESIKSREFNTWCEGCMFQCECQTDDEEERINNIFECIENVLMQKWNECTDIKIVEKRVEIL